MVGQIERANNEVLPHNKSNYIKINGRKEFRKNIGGDKESGDRLLTIGVATSRVRQPCMSAILSP